MTKRITQLTELTTPKLDMEIQSYDKDDTYDKKMSYENFMSGIVKEGAGIPTSAPDFKGQIYIDTTNGWRYIATGTSTTSDWHLQYAYGTVTVTGGGGDVTVSLGGNWIGGKLEVYFTETSSEYIDISTTVKFVTTHDALTDDKATYSSQQVLEYISDPSTADLNIWTKTKTTNQAALPKSATDTGFTLDDDGSTTVYVKWIIIA